MAKYKTFCQQLAVGFALLPLTALDATWLWNGFLWAAVILALVSGTQYMVVARQDAADRPVDTGRGHRRVIHARPSEADPRAL